MTILAKLVAVLTSLAALAAQSVGVTLSALVPLPVQVSDGLVNPIYTLPVGPLAFGGSVWVALPSAPMERAVLSWQTTVDNQHAMVTLEHVIQNPAGLPTFFGRAGRHEFLIEFTSALPRTTTLTVSRQLQVTAGATSPTVEIDFDNDGVIDIADPSPLQSTSQTVSFGPQPKLVRVVVDATLGAMLAVENSLTLLLEPDNDLVIVQPIATCLPSVPAQPPMLRPSFADRGIDIWPFALTPSVLVFGFAPQAALLSMNGLLPCILLPATDVVLPVTSLFHLPLPASVRPLTLFAQGVTLTPSGLQTTEGYVVQAN